MTTVTRRLEQLERAAKTQHGDEQRPLVTEAEAAEALGAFYARVLVEAQDDTDAGLLGRARDFLGGEYASD